MGVAIARKPMLRGHVRHAGGSEFALASFISLFQPSTAVYKQLRCSKTNLASRALEPHD